MRNNIILISLIFLVLNQSSFARTAVDIERVVINPSLLTKADRALEVANSASETVSTMDARLVVTEQQAAGTIAAATNQNSCFYDSNFDCTEETLTKVYKGQSWTISGTRSWRVPAGITQIYATVVSGQGGQGGRGGGGSSGYLRYVGGEGGSNRCFRGSPGAAGSVGSVGGTSSINSNLLVIRGAAGGAGGAGGAAGLCNSKGGAGMLGTTSVHLQKSMYLDVTPLSSLSITVGAGGLGGANGVSASGSGANGASGSVRIRY